MTSKVAHERLDDSQRASEQTLLSCGHSVLNPKQVHYCSYIQDPLIQELIQPKDELNQPREFSHPDEFQFILVHQACELSFEGCLFELKKAIQAMTEQRISDACDLVTRCRSWLMISARQIQHLVDHLTPKDFAYFRVYLSPASGAESIRFRFLEIMSGIGSESPYVAHRGHVFTFREFLDRAPKESPHQPKTCWWTEEMSMRAEEPSLRSAFEAHCGGGDEDHMDRALSGALGAQTQALAETLYKYERALLSIRRVHLHAAKKHISDSPGTGHTDGVLYLNSVYETARCFPILSEVAEMRAKLIQDEERES